MSARIAIIAIGVECTKRADQCAMSAKKTMTKQEFSSLIGEFIWSFSDQFFIETKKGNFIWSDPDYNGTNEVKKFKGSYKDWLKTINLDFGRCKGQHIIGQYIGENFILLSEVNL